MNKEQGREKQNKRERERTVKFSEINKIKEKPRILCNGYHLGGFIVFMANSRKLVGSLSH